MPVYEYEHIEGACEKGARFDVIQSMKEPSLDKCPSCGKAVRRRITTFGYQVVKSDSDLRNQGFVKLVRRSDGKYENVTALHGESRIWDPAKPETMPDLKRRIRD